MRPGAPGPPEHVHVELEEKFHVLEGELIVIVDGVERVATAGEWIVCDTGLLVSACNRREGRRHDFAVHLLSNQTSSSWRAGVRNRPDGAIARLQVDSGRASEEASRVTEHPQR